MRVPDAALEDVRQRGFALVEGFLGPDELEAAQRALWLHFPTPEDYFADPARYADYARSQFAGVLEFPYRSWDLNRLAFHHDLVDAAERFLRTTELHLYKVELWAKYAGAADYDQPLHRDYGSHSLVVPRRDGRYQQLTTFIFLSDVTEEDGPTRIVPYADGKDVPFTPLYIEL
ncbi:MAG TPA: phytanoyl-CoA dioxygenase family protein, partial [Acidimicrobiales bacterium]